MKTLKLFILAFIFNSLCIAQIYGDNNPEEKTLRMFIKLGMGKSNDYLNFGGGVFFPIADKFMLGLRGNINTEVDIFKTPSEHLADLELTGRYIPIIWKNIIVMAGAGVGFAGGKKRGDLISRPVFVAESYEENKFTSASFLLDAEIGYFLTKFLGVSIAGYSVFTNNKNITTYQIGVFLYGLK